nr:hypothetical protein GCM10025730_52050 [Promicromonospora thailandica]
MIRTLLVANRGEIALRIVRTARRLGLRTVAVYSDADAGAPHTRAADVAVRLGPTPPAESYLSVPALLAAAKESGADAVHPGYGFLSEQADFARAVVGAGLTWVGPPPAAMDAMARKDAAREVAERAGVPMLDSIGVVRDGWFARPGDAPYPLLVKAAAGGGGKGMRVVRTEDELAPAVAAAQREAAAAFGDGTVLLERFVERGRHIEVQVLADEHGTVLHLHERDCSAQRRHQKVLEEAPAPDLDPTLRGWLHTWAVNLAREVGYTGVGTVEFLVEDAAAPRADEARRDVGAWFLEMNTRLQVEHPVTEEVVTVRGERLDLVEQQLRVAAGLELGFTQDDVAVVGHAIEARLYAEDAFGGFLPQAGTAGRVRWPEHARVEAGLEDGTVVPAAYDPMVGKIITRGPDRETARHALVDALDATVVAGLVTNTGFVRALADSAAFRDGEVHTAWLDTHPLTPPDPGTALAAAAWGVAAAAARAGATAGGRPARPPTPGSSSTRRCSASASPAARCGATASLRSGSGRPGRSPAARAASSADACWRSTAPRRGSTSTCGSGPWTSPRAGTPSASCARARRAPRAPTCPTASWPLRCPARSPASRCTTATTSPPGSRSACWRR